MTVKVGIVGATGYAGAELVRLLLQHPQAQIAALSSKSFENMPLSEVYPAYTGFCDIVCENQSACVDKSDVIFAALPHGLSEPLAEECLEKGKKFIDLGADFRLESETDYKEWYGKSYDCPGIHQDAVYCIPELFRGKVEGKSIIANRGCYPTSAALGLFPALESGIVEVDPIVIDSKSGATGAGRGLSQTTHFCDLNEGFSPYKVACHRHTPEIEQSLSCAAGKPVKITFVPHLLPVNRGIISTMYTRLAKKVSLQEIHEIYCKKYQNEPFFRVLKMGDTANLKNVRMTNLCDISLHLDARTNTLIVVSAIDNMVKGAAGQAIQNMNLLFGLPETTGLQLVPPAF